MDANIVTFKQNRIYAVPSPLPAVVGDIMVITCNLWATPTGTPTVTASRRGSDASTLLTDSVAVNGRVVTLKTFTPNYAVKYVLNVKFVIGSSTYSRKIMVDVQSATSEQ